MPNLVDRKQMKSELPRITGQAFIQSQESLHAALRRVASADYRFAITDAAIIAAISAFAAQEQKEDDETQALLKKEFDEIQALIQSESNETQVKLDTLINAVNHNTTQMQTLLNSIIENTRQGIKNIVATINNKNPKVGQTGVKVSATITLDNDLPAPDKPVFSSNNTTVATIDQEGNVTLRSAGTVTFTAAARDEKGEVTVTVTEAE